MFVFLITLIYILIVFFGILAIIKINALIPKINAHKIHINNLNKTLFEQLREVQFRAKNITNYTNKLLKSKNSILGELFPSIIISVLPFKKIKSLLLLMRLGRKLF